MRRHPFLSLWWAQGGYSMAMWACFLGLCLVPLFVLAIEVSRLAAVVSDVQQAADAAALAAVREIDPEWWQQLGQERYTEGAALVYQKAQEYIAANTATASTRLAVSGAAITPREDLEVDLVKVEVSGSLRQLWLLGDVQVKKTGIAGIRMRHH